MYIDNAFQYFSHPEGYVIKENDGTYNYVFQYKDHLGNVRLSYKDNNGDGSISPSEIIEETNYYPFGMQHRGYNEAVLLSNLGQNIKYQGQERQEELQLNWDSFKWRNYDYAIGRFMSVDPLAEKYAHNGVYNFSENKVIHARELEGLEAVEINKGVDNLVIVALGRAGGAYGDGISNGKTLFSALEKGGFKDNGLNKLSTMSSMSNSKVIIYAGSDGDITASHIAQTIANYRGTNPNGTVSLIGHSLGGKAVLDAANIVNGNDNLQNKTINLVMTLEAASTAGARGSAYETGLGSNVLNILNFNSAKSSYSGGGGNTTGSSNESTVKLPSGTDHTNMDNTLTPYVPSILNNMYRSGTARYNDDSFKKAKVIPNDESSSY